MEEEINKKSALVLWRSGPLKESEVESQDVLQSEAS